MPSFNIEVLVADNTQSEEDFFHLGFHGAHSDDQLRAMSYVWLCSELESAQAGTTKYMLLESEKRRRDSVQASEPAKSEPHHAGQKPAQPHNDPIPKEPHWWKRPLGMTFLGVSIPVLSALVLYLLATHLGIP